MDSIKKVMIAFLAGVLGLAVLFTVILFSPAITNIFSYLPSNLLGVMADFITSNYLIYVMFLALPTAPAIYFALKEFNRKKSVQSYGEIAAKTSNNLLFMILAFILVIIFIFIIFGIVASMIFGGNNSYSM